ncbi:MAG: PPOX class F420-dependent oxidoreductase [Chloroflexi bacterium]|nr:PPOX class F420-dependent oxidoreductase [Chloroflexota bacterium]MBT4073807.1 PPOX class F420-dependent oxidoreductase [Chloroflexota bacterium]MBT4515514.1 PPOX class F420-dependent oxidoreductase [Chloroflexota bacterium]MBT6683112.1 PPOX class F420-dependent oxidoreductase [Chloroflexota bacterium]
MAQLTSEQVALLNEPHIAQVVTLMPDGSPQISPVWIDTDGSDVLFNTALGRVKTDNMERDARVAVGVYDAANPTSRVVNIRGRVTEITEDGADAHIDKLAKKYTGTDSYGGHNPDQTRVIVRITPDNITGR